MKSKRFHILAVMFVLMFGECLLRLVAGSNLCKALSLHLNNNIENESSSW